MGKPWTDSKSAHPMVPTLLLIFRAFTSMPVQDDDRFLFSRAPSQMQASGRNRFIISCFGNCPEPDSY